MKTIEVSGNEPALKPLLELAGEESVIVKTASGREFIVTEIDDFAVEVARTRQNRELMAFLDERSKDPVRIPFEHVKKELGID
ncbi:MAG TPA: hypothetical protein VFA77_02855 [Candidatus Eisenbacteria bacterium]|jgi:hypothetical protein|nr:hypothetical protein [Candidatus Eisenbacteria bacterium]